MWSVPAYSRPANNSGVIFFKCTSTGVKLSARTTTTAGAASAVSGTLGGASSAGGTSHHHHHHHRKHRSRSTPRYADVEKPKKKKILSGGSTSLVSIPNAIKLSMLNSGLMSLGEYPEIFLICSHHVNFRIIWRVYNLYIYSFKI